jgi:putative DNA primase/helicase
MITARHLYRGAFDFRPQCKIWLATNHSPNTSDTSPAMRDRMRIVPFTRRVTQAQRNADPDFAARLISELPGIAAWMVRGLAAYMRAGQSLGPLPVAVAAASNQWAHD